MLAKIEKDRGWVIFEPWLYTVMENLKIIDYAKFYVDESIIPKLFVVAMFDLDEFKELNAKIEKGSPEEQTAFLDEWIAEVDEADAGGLWGFEIPETLEEQEEARKLFESFSEEDRADVCKRAACFLVFFILNFHDYLALRGCKNFCVNGH